MPWLARVELGRLPEQVEMRNLVVGVVLAHLPCLLLCLEEGHVTRLGEGAREGA